MNRNILLFVLFIGTCGLLTAQEPDSGPTLRPGFGWSQAGSEELAKQYATALESTTTGAYDPAADKLLAAADKYTRDVFRVPRLHLERAATQRSNGDVLQVWWKFDESSGNGDLLLIDDPFDSNYWLRFSGPEIPGSSDLVKMILGLITWKAPQLNWRLNKFFQIHLPADGAAPDHFRVQTLLTNYSNSKLRFEMIGFEDQGIWLVNVSIGKHVVRGYPVPPLIPERFPPLEELVRTWSSRRIWSEVGATYAKDGYLSEYRDRVLMDELLDRGLTTEQVVELMINTDTSNLRERARDVLELLEGHGQAKAAVPAVLVPVLKFYESTGAPAASATDTLFFAASSTCGGEEIDNAALRVLSARLSEEGPLRYLRKCSTSQETIDRLERITLRRSQVLGKDVKESVRKEIEKRIANRK